MSLCPCGSEKEYADCCQPLIQGERLAKTAEELLRSRYSAHVKHDVDYILQTVLPDQAYRHDRKAIDEWSRNTSWKRLEIKQIKDGGENDIGAIIEFSAFFMLEGLEKEHHEVALFRKIDGKWYFDDGETKLEPIVNENKRVKPNDPCPCGSGKKHKKCCGR